MQQSDLIKAVFEFVILIFSLCVHECAHAWTASYLGDQTARLQGRVTLNPVYHVDPVGTLLFPGLAIFGPFIGLSFFSGMLVGWAKPTPVITRNFQKIRRDDNLTTLAGPVSNLLIVLASFLILVAMSLPGPEAHQVVIASFIASLSPGGASMAQPVVMLCSLAILINLMLCIFNLFPIPPLDGSRLIRNQLPYNAMQAYDRIPIWVSYLLMIFVGGFVIRLFLGPALEIIYTALRMV